jgi:hypothetical protein
MEFESSKLEGLIISPLPFSINRTDKILPYRTLLDILQSYDLYIIRYPLV